MTENAKTLRPGFTTGAAAAAATKGAIHLLLGGKRLSRVEIEPLTRGEHLSIPIHTCISKGEKTAICTVIKDAGDDPDITHKAEIGATVTLLDHGEPDRVIISGGRGVGSVTKPGLEILPGEPAINPGPRKMITQAAKEVLAAYHKCMAVKIEIFVPQGEMLARKTLNARLGILGGISILGTTGIVRPMSHEAYIATIRSGLSVARAMGLDQVVMTTGRRSERYAQALWDHLPEEAFIQIGDFFKASLESAAAGTLRRVTLAVFFGKAVKMAQGIPHTHAAKSSLTMHRLSEWSYRITKDQDFAERVLAANTARHAYDLIMERYPELVQYVGKQMICSAQLFAGQNLSIGGVIFGYEGHVIFDSETR